VWTVTLSLSQRIEYSQIVKYMMFIGACKGTVQHKAGDARKGNVPTLFARTTFSGHAHTISRIDKTFLNHWCRV